MNKPVKNKKAFIIILAGMLAAVLLICGICLFPKLMPEASFRIGARIRAVFSGAALKESALTEDELVLYTEDELKGDERVTFDRSMMLINSDNLLPGDFQAAVTEYKDSGVLMDSSLTGAYESLAAAVFESCGKKLYIKSSYRTREEQAAEIEASAVLAAPLDASEHQAGLALDVYVPFYAGASFIRSDAGRYVANDGWKSGFIIRYPYYAVDKTGISYEPWHIRYVGAPHAEIITKSCLCLEEYLAGIKENCVYEYGGYTVMKQNEADANKNGFRLPAEFASAVISPDNCGNYIITVRLS